MDRHLIGLRVRGWQLFGVEYANRVDGFFFVEVGEGWLVSWLDRYSHPSMAEIPLPFNPLKTTYWVGVFTIMEDLLGVGTWFSRSACSACPSLRRRA